VRKTGGENEDRSAKRAMIRALNDAFRKSFWGGRVMMTAGVAALENPARNAVVEKIKVFDTFDDDNDPWGGEEPFVKSAKLSLRKDEVLGVIGKLKYQDK
jgi:hypothetical protein